MGLTDRRLASVLNILVNGVAGQYLFGEEVLYGSLLLGLVVVLGSTAAYVLGWTALYRSHSRRLIAYRVFGGSMALAYMCLSVIPYQPFNGWPCLAEFLEYDDPRAYFGVPGTIMENLVYTFNAVLQGVLILRIRLT